MKYPIGIQSFDQLIEDGYVYVDKTDLVYKLTHEGKIYFTSRFPCGLQRDEFHEGGCLGSDASGLRPEMGARIWRAGQ